MKIRGVIFDMDGTITAPYLDFAGLKKAAGIGEVDLIEYLRSATGADYERMHALLVKFEEDGVANARLNRGARTLLRFLARRKIPTGLLTRNSRKSVEGVCRKFGLAFDLVITREDGPHKPAPEPIWEMGKTWGVRPGELLMVGDYKWDVVCAKNAGARSVLLVNGGTLPEWAGEADFVVRKLTEVVGVIEGRRQKAEGRRRKDEG
ncbi:MAG: HAD family hydrolase [Acidobacteria bacterium]|nr:HAD family hydrolase [Acidobacteriota bacterium]